jgi:two-component system, OmpR family, response regulator CpxR
VQEIEAHILLVDDDAELGTLMRDFFAEHGIDVALAHNGPAGLQAALARTYDLVLLDVMMPGFDGFEVLRRLRETSGVPVLMLTARTESASRIRGLEGGADDYLPKPFEPLELLARIRAILRRTRPSVAETEAPVEVSGVRIEPASRRVSFEGRPVDVTTIEYDILDTLMRSAGRVVSRDDLMRRLYGRESTPFDRSIDVHVSHLRKKLEAPRELIQTVRGVGYQFAVETPLR